MNEHTDLLVTLAISLSALAIGVTVSCLAVLSVLMRRVIENNREINERKMYSETKWDEVERFMRDTRREMAWLSPKAPTTIRKRTTRKSPPKKTTRNS